MMAAAQEIGGGRGGPETASLLRRLDTESEKRGKEQDQDLARAPSQGSSQGQRRAQPIVRVRSQSVVRIRVQPTVGPGPASDQPLLIRLLVEAAPLLAGISGGAPDVLLDPLC